MRIPAGHYQQLRDLAVENGTVPDWLIKATADGWRLHLRSRPINEVVVVRQPSDYGYGRASWELNLGCSYDCEHCYLDIKRFEGLTWDQRVELLHILREAGVAAAVEMERAGVAEAAYLNGSVPILTIRGISDHAHDKHTTDPVGWQPVAAANAAQFAPALIAAMELQHHRRG